MTTNKLETAVESLKAEIRCTLALKFSLFFLVFSSTAYWWKCLFQNLHVKEIWFISLAAKAWILKGESRAYGVQKTQWHTFTHQSKERMKHILMIHPNAPLPSFHILTETYSKYSFFCKADSLGESEYDNFKLTIWPPPAQFLTCRDQYAMINLAYYAGKLVACCSFALYYLAGG